MENERVFEGVHLQESPQLLELEATSCSPSELEIVMIS